MIKTYYVYTHSRADNGAVFYVGCSTKHTRKGRDPYSRMRDVGLRTAAWFETRSAAGGHTMSVVFETIDRAKAFALERELITQYGRADLGRGPLVNQTDGGAGAGGQIVTAETRRRKSVQKLGALNPMYGKPGLRARPVIHIRAGVFYDSVQDAADAMGMKMKTLYNMLSGHRPNSTALRFA